MKNISSSHPRILKWVLMLTLLAPVVLWALHFSSMSTESSSQKHKDHVLTNNSAEKPLDKALQTSGTSFQNKDKKIHGIDVSHFQGDIRWPDVAKSGVYFAYAKATGGETFTDPQFKTNWHELRKHQIYRGAYHFFFAADDPKIQAQHFIKTVGKLLPNDLPPMLDIEISDHVDAKEIQQRALIWLKEVEQAMGVLPMVYTDNGFADTILTDSEFSRYPLWIADYSSSVQGLPPPWKQKQWVIWQHSQTGKVNGVSGDVDLDIFNGDKNAFQAFIEHSHNPRL